MAVKKDVKFTVFNLAGSGILVNRKVGEYYLDTKQCIGYKGGIGC